MTVPESDRHIRLQGGYNFRDMGGYPTRYGRPTPWGRMYRSAALSDLTDDDCSRIGDLGIRRVYDLRSEHERRSRPAPTRLSEGLDIWTREQDSTAGDLVRALQEPHATPNSAVEMMAQLYRSLPETLGEAVADLVRHVAETDTPILIHCAAGKDRTGAMAAILLDLLEVPRSVIVEDYLLTNVATQRSWEDIRSGLAKAGVTNLAPGLWSPVLRAEPQYLAALFDAIDQTDGSSAAYVRRWLGPDGKHADKSISRLLCLQT